MERERERETEREKERFRDRESERTRDVPKGRLKYGGVSSFYWNSLQREKVKESRRVGESN